MSSEPRKPSVVLRCATALLVALASLLVWAGAAQAQAQAQAPVSRVLVLFSWNSVLPWQVDVERGLDAGFKMSGLPVERSVEYLDSGRFPSEAMADAMATFLVAKYGSAPPDVLLAEGVPATRFLKARPRLFAQARKILINYTGEPAYGEVAVPVRSDFRAAIVEALAVSGATKVYAIGDLGDTGAQARLDDFRARMAEFNGIAYEELIDLPPAELWRRVATLPKGGIIFYLLAFKGENGGTTTPFEMARQLAEQAPVPVFSHWTSLMGSGVVGGYQISGERVGAAASAAALALLAGKSTAEVTDGIKPAHVSVYDWRQLRRWGIDPHRLPAGAEIKFRDKSLIDEYRWPLALVVSVTAILVLSVLVLVRLNYLRRMALAQLGEERALLEQRVAERTTDLSRATAALERSNQDLQQFAYAASHDLREPLRSVTGYLQLIDRRYGQSFDAEGREHMAFAIEGGRRMHTMIGDLLDYSRINLDAVAVGAINTESLLADALVNLHALIADSGARISHSTLPLVFASGSQVCRLFQNLIANAIKYAAPDRVPEIHIEANCDGVVWEFSVTDNGIGIPAEFRERIFGLFQRLHDRRRYEGTGVGLALCKRIVERHGGTIWVDSTPGRGSTFHFTLPVVRDTADLAVASD